MNRRWVIILLLIASTGAVYWQVKEHGFILADDPLYIVDNPNVQRGLSIDNIVWAFTTGYAANWHPLTWLSHMLDHNLYGMNPAGHHLTSAFLHIMNSILVFLVFSRMTGSIWRSAFVAGIFALHPLHVESVAWAAERKDVLAALFWMLSMLSYTYYVEKKERKHYLLVLVFFSLGLMAKPIVVTLPFVLLLLDYWPLRRFMSFRENRKRSSSKNEPAPRQAAQLLALVQEKRPLFVLSAISSVITLLVQQRGGAVSSWSYLPLDSRIANALVAYIGYLGKTFWPLELAVFYPHPLTTLPLWQPVVAGVLLVAISVLAIRAHRAHPYFLVGWFWFLGTLIPVIGLVQVGEQSLADRYMYLPLVGLSIIMAWGANQLSSEWRNRRTILLATGSTLLFALIIQTWFQVSYWKDTLTLFDHATRVTSNNYVALANIGTVLQSEGRTDAAIDHYEQSLKINPTYELAHYDLAVALQTRGEQDKARAHYEEAIRLRPDNAGSHYGLAMILSEMGETGRSKDHYLKALQIDPDYWQAHFGLGLTFGREGISDSAIVHFARVLQLKPDNPNAHFQLGVVLHQKGELQGAITHYSQAIRLKPDYAVAHANLGAALHQLGRIPEAVVQYRQALRLDPDNANARNNLEAAMEILKKKQNP